VTDRWSTATATAIDETAANWLLRLEAAPSAQLREGLRKWLAADPRHAAAFIRLRCAWNRIDKLRLLRPTDGLVDEDLLAKLTLDP
jgi:ferric-dicitrate binding protein FerR (iron transport regulator)